MKVKIIAGSNTYLIAGVSHAAADGNYQGRLLNELKLKNAFSSSGNSPLTLNISIRNNDAYIAAAVNLWAAAITVTADGGQSWSGKITAYDSDGDGVMYIVATEKSAPEVTIQIPDEVARLVTLDDKFHTSAINMTLPLVIGGTEAAPHLIKGILIDKTAGIYLLCVGENHQVVKVYSGTEELTAGFTAYTGTAGQANFPGFAYVEITDAALRKNDDGSYAEISAEIIGLKLGTSTIEECRNGARFLYWLLKTAKDGVCGWGLGIAEADIDATVFNTAIAAVATAGLKLDGIFYYRQSAQSWIDQICQSIRGTYSIGQDGKRKLYVNVNAASSITYTAQNIKLLRYGKGAYTGQVFNKGKLDYDYNPLTGQFMNFATYQNSTSIADIEEQDFYGQSYLIKDATTAQAILEYTCKRSLIGAEKVYFETDTLPVTGIKIGDVITVDYPEKSLSGTWQITGLQIGDFVHTIEAEKFDSSIFSVGTPGTAINWMKDPPVVSPVLPGVASGLTLSSEVRPSPDGTNIVVIKGAFTPPAGSYIAASIEWGEGILPILSWNDRGMMQGSQFEIAPVKPAQAYAVRIRMVTATGKSSYITGTLTTEGDTVPPGKPSISATSSLKNVSINLSLASVPSDMAGFAIFRNTSNNSGTATQIGYVESSKGTAQTVDINTEYGSTYYYWAKAVDTWGNPSVFSDAFGPLTISMILNADVSPEAIKQAIGSVASWSAKNCTTDSIAEASGVKDVSGNGNHGRAYGGVAVVNSKMGQVFQFDGVNDYIQALNIEHGSVFSFSLWASFSDSNWIGSIIGFGSSSTDTHNLYFFGDDNDKFGLNSWNTDIFGIAGASFLRDGNMHHIVANITVGDYTKFELFVNGVKQVVSQVKGTTLNRSTSNQLGVGSNGWSTNQTMNGRIGGIKIFNRALSATEVKSIYMFPDDVAFGRVTADLVATGTLQALIAQITEAFIQDAHIVSVNAAKILVGYLDAARIAANSITAAKVDSTIVKTLELQVYGKNRCPDPSFDGVPYSASYTTFVAAAGLKIGVWECYASTYSGHIYTGHKLRTDYPSLGATEPGTNVVFLSPAASGSLALRTPMFTVKPGPYNFSVSLKTQSGVPSVRVLIDWHNSTGTYLSYSAAIGQFTPPSSATRYNSNVTAPSGAAFARIYLWNVSPSGGAAQASFSAVQFEEGSTSTAWVNRELGIVTTDRLVTGQMKSLNYSTTAGSLLDLDNGDIKMGGSSAPRFSFTNSTNSGTFAGFSFNATDMTAGASTTAIGISTDTAKRAFWAGSATPANAPFNVTHAGAMNASSGSIGSFTVSSQKLSFADSYSNNTYMNFNSLLTASITCGNAVRDLTIGPDTIEANFGTYYARILPQRSTDYTKPTIRVRVGGSTYYAIECDGLVRGYIENISDESVKSNINSVDVLDSLKRLPVTAWNHDEEKANRVNYEKSVEEKIRESNAIPLNNELLPINGIEDYLPKKKHIGPMAGDFNKAFGINGDNTAGYLVGDAIGVALRAIQELAEIVDDLKEENKELRVALNLPEKQERKKKEVESELTDVQKDFLHIVEKRAQKSILKKLLEAEKK